jgi:hypothetical protein
MSSLVVVPVLVVLTIGSPAPIDRAVRAAAGSQAAPSTVVQASCPTLADFAIGPSTLLAVALPVDKVFSTIDQALRVWSEKDLPDVAKGNPTDKVELRRNASLVVEPDPVQALGQQPVSKTVGRTCFYEWRIGNRDSRIAFRFSVRSLTRQGTTLELRWLSQIKGSAQRTWRTNPADPGLLKQRLTDRIRQGN